MRRKLRACVGARAESAVCVTDCVVFDRCFSWPARVPSVSVGGRSSSSTTAWLPLLGLVSRATSPLGGNIVLSRSAFSSVSIAM
jgi:hypothetical protein